MWALWQAGHDTHEIAADLHRPECAVYNTLARTRDRLYAMGAPQEARGGDRGDFPHDPYPEEKAPAGDPSKAF